MNFAEWAIKKGEKVSKFFDRAIILYHSSVWLAKPCPALSCKEHIKNHFDESDNYLSPMKMIITR